jgi:UPF0755 protein
MTKKLILIFILPPIFAAVFVSIHVGYLLKKAHSKGETEFTINPGEGFSTINYRLSQAELISNTRVFHYYARHKNLMNKFKAGTYTIAANANIPQVIEILVYGKPNLTSITIPEGKNLYEIAKLLEENEITKANDFILLAKSGDVLRELNIDGPNIEGYLYPETYKFAKRTPAKQVLQSMVSLFKQTTQSIDLSHPTLNPKEIIILASMVEKETGAKHERATIAGVFHNRLKKKMRLQSDPTTIYGIYETYNGNLRKTDLLNYTEYNTYKIPALPIGPICNPSLAAIKAVLNPEQHDYLYFVSRNDGTHIFTSTYKEHNQAVDEWQKNRVNRQGKSWRDLKQ